MKKVTACLCVLLMTGCAEGKASSVVNSNSSDGYASYVDAVNNMSGKDSYTAAVRSSYEFSYSDDSRDMYMMDGVLSMMNENSDPVGHITQHISSNGMTSESEGYYYGGRLYNSYNNVNYYEDMDVSSLKKTLMVPLNPLVYDESDVESFSVEQGDDETVYRIVLKSDAAGDVFSSRYDQYGFNEYDDYAISDNLITDTFDAAGEFKKEEASFTVGITYSGQAVSVKYSSSVEYSDGDTVVEVSDAEKEKDAGYIAYSEIDPSSISGEVKDDSAESTVTDTFKKRLVNRLGYEVSGDGIYKDTFNDEMSYMIDFNSHTFEYTNYSIAYVYNWKTDMGSMSACTYDFASGNQSGDCTDSTVDNIKEVKNYLQMELYYCGLSLEDLQAEN